MIINNKTKVYISISKYPGNTGSLLHNNGYKMLNLNCIYIPFKCRNNSELKLFLNNENFKGISVSMPFKSKVIKFINKIDDSSKKSGAVNTVIRFKKKLIGFNTDFFALKKIIKLKKFNIKNCLILGNGSTSKTSYEVLKELKVKKIYLSSRNKKKYKFWKIRKNDVIIDWAKRNFLMSDLLINCTPIGMKHINNIPIKLTKNNQYKYIIDFPINKKSKLSFLAKKNNITYVSGLEISLYQGIEQFKIYTHKKLSVNNIKKKLNYNFNV